MIQGIAAVLGTAAFGTTLTPADSFKLMDTFAALGGRMIDTANNYAYWVPQGRGGESETVIGQWLAKQRRRDFTVITKIGSQVVGQKNGVPMVEGLSPRAIRQAVEQCCIRLQTDCLDILLAHHDHPGLSLLEMWSAFSVLKAIGKVRGIGVSNYTPARLRELAELIARHALAPIDALQMKYSVIAPLPTAVFEKLEVLDDPMKQTIRDYMPQAAVFAYSPLLGGLFENPQGQWPAEYDTAENRHKVRTLQDRAKEKNVSPSALVLKMITDEGYFPVTATGSPARLQSNLALVPRS